jgi:hypothetical protein
MSRPIAYNASGPLSGSIRGGNVNYTVDSGNRDYTTFASKKWVPSADGAAPIVFVTDTYTQGFELNPSLAVPLFYSCNGTGSAAIIYTANRIPGSPGNYSDANVALNDLINARGYFILESNDPFEGVDADGLVLDLDAAKMSSYPQTGTTWRDLSGQNNITNLLNGPTWNSNGWIVFDSTDDYADTSVNTNALFSSNDPFSVSITIKPTETINANSGLVTNQKYQSEISPGGFGLVTYNSNQVAINLTKNDGTGTVSYEGLAPTTLTINSWQNITYTYDPVAGTVTGYKNGTLSNSSTSAVYKWTPEARVSWIGRNWQGGWSSDFFSSEISNVSIYRRTLSQSDIKQNYFGAPIVTDGLVFAVDANNIVSYPKSGTAWYQLTGSANNGTLTNGPTFKANNGGVISLDGTDDFIDFGSVNFQTSDSITLDMWIYPQSATQEAYADIFDANHSGLGFVLQQDYLTYNYYYFAYYAGSGFQVTSNIYIDPYVWSHIVITKEGNQTKMYKNGQLVTNNTMTNPSLQGTNILYLGKFVVGGRQWKGEYGNFKGYNRALTAAEVQQNYQAEQYRFETPAGVPTSGLQLWLDAGNLDSYPGTGTTWYDLSNQGNNMTLVNGPTYNQTNGGVIIFDGIDDYAQRTLSNCSTSFKTMTEYTVVSVFQSLDPTTDWNCLYSFGDTSPGNIDNWQQTGTRYFGSDNQSLYTNVDLYTAGINMWAQTFTSGDNKIYRNNTLNTSNAAPTIANPSVPGGFIIANRPEDFGFATKMNMNLMLIYNRVLTTAELTQIYNYYKGRFGL